MIVLNKIQSERVLAKCSRIEQNLRAVFGITANSIFTLEPDLTRIYHL